MTREKRLGRGLEALLGRMAGDPSPPADPPPANQPPDSGPPETQDRPTIPGPYGGAVAEPYRAVPEPGTPTTPRRRTAEAEATPPEQVIRQPPDAPAPTVPDDRPERSTPAVDESLMRLDVSRIESNPFQPRRDFDEAELQSLADSLLAHGLLQPIVVRRFEDRFQLVAGERRLQAAAKAGWTEVPAQIVEADDRQMAELAIVENMHRKDLNALEKAASFRRYLEQYECTQEELATRLKLDRSTIANLIRLLELPEAVQEAVRRAKITPGHARALLPLGDEPEQVELCRRIQEEAISVRQTERLVQEKIEEADAEPLGVVGLDGRSSRPQRIKSEHLTQLEQELRAALGVKVKITHSGRGRGKLVIPFKTHEEFERLRRHICETSLPDRQNQVG